MTMTSKERQSPGMLSNWIGGVARPPSAGDFLEDYNPATGEINAWIPRSQGDDVNEAVQAALAALRGPWGRSTVAERADLCDAIADRIAARADELAHLESQDTGKPVSLAASVDIPRAIANFRFFAGAIRHNRSDMHPMADAINYTHRKPVGVVGLITPWNLPLYLLSWKTAPALAMGNVIVAKPSEITPLTAAVLAEIITDVGGPDGVFNLIHGFGHEAGQALVEHPDVKAISFTGGTGTGTKVASTAAPMFKKLSLELGGKNPTIVFADCDFDLAVDGAVRAGFANQGQVCLCGSRLLVESSIYDRFVAAFVAKVKAIKVGDPADPETVMGSLVSQEHRTKVEGCLELAKEEGGRILCGGTRPGLAPPFAGGAFLNPTVIADLSPQCRTIQEEIFGPVVTVQSFDNDDEALALANGVPYGLSATVWTRDLVRAHRFSEALDVGMVWVNTWLHRDLRVPFGGVKDSGVGREGGQLSLDFFSESSNICIHLGRSREFAPSPGSPTLEGHQAADAYQTESLASPISGVGSGTSSYATSDSADEPKKKVDTDVELAAIDSRTIAYTEGIDESVLASLSIDPSTTIDYVQVASSLPIANKTMEHTLEQKRAAAASQDALHGASHPRARRVGELLFLSGVGPHSPKTNAIVGGPTHDQHGNSLDYHFSAQALAVVENIRIILESVGSSLDNIVDVTVFLIDMDRDLAIFEKIFSDYFSKIQATRTIVAVKALSSPIAIECKVVAKA